MFPWLSMFLCPALRGEVDPDPAAADGRDESTSRVVVHVVIQPSLVAEKALNPAAGRSN